MRNRIQQNACTNYINFLKAIALREAFVLIILALTLLKTCLNRLGLYHFV